MSLQETESDIQTLFQQWVPDWPSLVSGATEKQIVQLTRIAGRPLPKFYEWFLRIMGRQMGPLGYARLDCSAAKLISCYEGGTASPHPRFLLIGYSSDPVVPMHRFYDLDFPARDDARIVETDDIAGSLEGNTESKFETLREMLAWNCFWQSRVLVQPYRCRGIFVDEGQDLPSKLYPMLESLGFVPQAPGITGPHCGLYDQGSSAMVVMSKPDEPPKRMAFTLGGNQPDELKEILQKITEASGIVAKISEWTPPAK